MLASSTAAAPDKVADPAAAASCAACSLALSWSGVGGAELDVGAGLGDAAPIAAAMAAA
jgi:hypothetical protein